MAAFATLPLNAATNLNSLLRFRIERARRFVKDQYLRIGVERSERARARCSSRRLQRCSSPCDRNALLLTAAQLDAAVADRRVDAVREFVDEIARLGHA